jgi:hypothetical protein
MQAYAARRSAASLFALRQRGRGCEAQHVAGHRRWLRCSQLTRNPTVEVLLLLWDEMDDWLGAARHVLGRLT